MRIEAMSKIVVFLLAASCAHGGSGGGGGGGQAGGGTGPVPAEVRKIVDATLGPNARITSERENGHTIYEAAIQTKLELELSDTGKLQKTEVALPVGTLPTAVAAAVKGPIKEAEVVILPSGVAFEVEVGNTEYTIDASGKILAQETEEGDDED